MRRAAALLFLLLAWACGGGGTAGRDARGGEDVATRALSLVEAERFDEAIAAVGSAEDAESLYLLGRAWAGKARSAPVPTPAPGASSAVPPFKPEESRALEFLERAVSARPDHAPAQLALADLLAPHALARPRAAGGRPASPPPGPDASLERVLRVYAEALQADPAGTEAAEALIRFATAAGRAAEVDGAYQELTRRRREDPDLLIRYGDFLAGPGRKPEEALAQYAQALIWRPDDEPTRLKMTDIHLRASAEHLSRREYAAAEARLGDAKRLKPSPSSPQGARLRDIEQQLRDIRWR